MFSQGSTPWGSSLEMISVSKSSEEIVGAIDSLKSSSHQLSPALYTTVFETITSKLSASWSECDRLFIEVEWLLSVGEPSEILRLLLASLKKSKRFSFEERCLLRLLEVYRKTVLEAFLNASSSLPLDGAAESDFIQLIVSIPDRVACCGFLLDYGSQFITEEFYSFLCDRLANGLYSIWDHVRENRDCSLKFHGRLIGKLAVVGQAQVVVEKVFMEMLANCHEDFVWRRIAQTFFRNILTEAYEPLLSQLISTVQDGKDLVHLTGYSPDNFVLRHLFDQKFFFNRIFAPPKDVVVYQRLFQYFVASDENGLKFIEILLRLLEAWSKGYGAKYMAYEYELSLTKAVLLGLGVLKECVHFEHNYGQRILRFAMHGLEKRLLSSDIAIRRNGMIVGETITAIISPAPDTVLKFDYPEDENAGDLKALRVCVPLRADQSKIWHPTWVSYSAHMPEDDAVPDIASSNIKNGRDECLTKDVSNGDAEEADSDDDLIPCTGCTPGSALNTKHTFAGPRYLQECYEGLLNKDDSNRRRLCLASLSGLVLEQIDVADSMVEDLMKVLLSMELQGSLNNCKSDRFNSLKRITVDFPHKAGLFLGREIRKHSYGIGVRLEMLQVLRSASADMFGCFRTRTASPDRATHTKVVPSGVVKSKGTPLTPIVSWTGKRGTCRTAKFYIVPLLSSARDDRKSCVLLEQEDVLLLSHLVYTLGLIINHARNLPDTPMLAKAALEIVWTYRHHPDMVVKQSVLSCIAIILDSLPSDLQSLSSAQVSVEELQVYLSEIRRTDPSSRSIELAAHVQRVVDQSLQTALSSEFSSIDRTSMFIGVNALSSRKLLSLRDIRDLALSTSFI